MTASAAARLVALYPAVWRGRYGEEFQQLLIAQRLTPMLALDVCAGAIDAHVSGGRMTMKMMARCAAGGPRLSTAEAWRAAVVMLGVAALLAGGLMWARAAFQDSPYIDAIAAVAFPAAILVTLPFLTNAAAGRRRQIVTTVIALVILALSAVLSVAI